jgi:hypothetical protein
MFEAVRATTFYDEERSVLPSVVSDDIGQIVYQKKKKNCERRYFTLSKVSF